MKLCGFIDKTQALDSKQRLCAMVEVMSHAPGLEKRTFAFRDGGLAVVDRQPFYSSNLVWNKDRSVCLASCGHVGTSDGSVPSRTGPRSTGANDLLVDLLSKSPIETLRKLDGVFALAMYDRRTGSLMLAADRFGFMPLYYCHRDDFVVFASEVKALLQVLQASELDWSSLADFFYVGHMLGNRTLFRDIYALDPGEVIIHCGGQSEHMRYHDFTQVKILPREEVSADRVAALFTRSVERRAEKNVSNTVLLSGGLDSRLVAGALMAAGVSPKTISLEHVDECEGADGRLGCLIAESLGLESELRPTRKNFFGSGDWLKPFYILDGMVPNLELFISEVHRELDPRFGIVWDGLALDVVLGGAHQRRGGIEVNLGHLIGKRPVHRCFLRLILAARQFHLLDDGFLTRLAAEVAKIPDSENQFLFFLLTHRTRRRIAVNPYQLYSTQVAPMTPAADVCFMNYVLSIPGDLKLGHKLYIEMLRKCFPQLTRVPAISGGEMVSFDSAQLDVRAGAVLTRLTRIGAMAVKQLRRIPQTYDRIRRRLKSMHDGSLLLIQILVIRSFDRPFYNRRLLRFFFFFYRRGVVILHPLFKTVCYLELWHLLFLDKNSALHFNPSESRLRDQEAVGLAGSHPK